MSATITSQYTVGGFALIEWSNGQVSINGVGDPEDLETIVSYTEAE